MLYEYGQVANDTWPGEWRRCGNYSRDDRGARHGSMNPIKRTHMVTMSPGDFPAGVTVGFTRVASIGRSLL